MRRGRKNPFYALKWGYFVFSMDPGGYVLPVSFCSIYDDDMDKIPFGIYIGRGSY